MSIFNSLKSIVGSSSSFKSNLNNSAVGVDITDNQQLYGSNQNSDFYSYFGDTVLLIGNNGRILRRWDRRP